jgi:hypothetical protein
MKYITRRRPRPILATYENGRGVFKKGKSTTVEASIVAAVRTLLVSNIKHARVVITGPKGTREARVMRGQNITVLF